MPKILDMIEKISSGKLLQTPVARLIGFRLTSIERGGAIIELESSERHTNPMGTLHGGILCDIADAAMVFGLRQYSGRRRIISLTECDVIDEKKNLIARATSTCMTLREERAQGR